MQVINDSELIHITASFSETADIVEGLRKGIAAHEIAGNWQHASELKGLADELANPDVELRN